MSGFIHDEEANPNLDSIGKDVVSNVKKILEGHAPPMKPKPKQLDPKTPTPGAGAFIANSVTCIIFSMFGGVPIQVHKRSYKLKAPSFKWNDQEYIIMTDDKTKVKLIRAPWHSMAKYNAVLEYIQGEPIPLSHEKSELLMDAAGLARVTSKSSRDNLLPSTDSMLMMLMMLSLVGMLIAMGLAGYMLTVPNGAENIKSAINPNTSRPTTNTPPPQTTTPNR